VADNGAFAGINAAVFGQLVHSMQTGMSDAQPLASYYQGRFGQLGLDTGAVGRLQQDYGWAQGQQPMLQYRYQLASALNQPQGNFTSGMTTAGAGDLKFPSARAAQQAGTKAARQYQDGQLTLTQFLSLLGDDPDFDTGAFTVLGSDGLYQLEDDIHSQPDPAPGLKVLATAVSAAMAGGYAFPDDDGQPAFGLLAGLVPYAGFPAAVLVSLAEEADTTLNNSAPARVQAVYTALARNPEAAAQFIAQFARDHAGESFAQYISSTGVYASSYGQQFADIVTAGTVGVQGTDPRLAAQNATSMIEFYSAGSGATGNSALQLAFARIVSAYWPDVQGALTDPRYPGSADGLDLPPATAAQDWQAFIMLAMQNPKASADLLQFSTQEAETLAAQNAGDPYAHYASGLIEGVFSKAALTVYQQQLQASSDAAAAWETTFQAQLGTVVNTGIGIALAPETAGSSLISAAILDAAGQFTSGIAAAIPNIHGDTQITPPVIVTWQETIQREAGTAWQSNHDLGNPAGYARQFGCPPFLDAGGSLVSNATPAQQRAYNAWLRDPVVWAALDSDFLNSSAGNTGGLTGSL
jgi:hypothetical protein